MLPATQKRFAGWITAAVLLFLAGCGLAWHFYHLETLRRQAAGVIPAIPDLAEWPPPFVDALHDAHQAAIQHPLSAEKLATLVLLYDANGFFEQADQLLTVLLVMDASEARWPYYLSKLRQASGDNEAALHLLETTLQLAPDYAPAHLAAAELSFKQGDLTTAHLHYTERLRLLPNDPYASIGLARISLQTGDNSEAIRQLETLIAHHPSFSSALNLLAELRAESGDRKAAARLQESGHRAGRFREADDPWQLALNDWCYDPYRLVVIASTLEQTDRLEASIPYLERAVQLSPDKGLAYEVLGRHYLYLNHLDAAEITLRRGIVADPTEPALVFTLCKVLLRKGRPEQAKLAAEAGLLHFPTLPEMFNQLGIACDAAELRADAILAYTKALQLDDLHFESHLNLAKTLIKNGDTRSGDDHLQRALRIQPWHADALVYAIGREMDTDRMEAALEHLNTLEPLEPGTLRVRQLRALWQLKHATILAKSGDVESALAAFDTGIAADPTVADLYANKGVLLSQQQRFPEAITPFRRFVELEPEKAIGYLNLGYAQLRAGLTELEKQTALQTLENGLRVARRQKDESVGPRIYQLLSRLRAEADQP